MPALTHERSAQLWKSTLSGCLHRSVTLSASSRRIQSNDVSALGLLFCAAFQGTIDEAGQTEAQYALKASAILGGRYGEWIAEASWAVEQPDGLLSACLVCNYKPYGCPVIAAVATAPASKRAGAAGTLLDAAMAALAALGHFECCAMITKGNLASERLFESRGFSPHSNACDS
ncbi:GNAT family N-acetyltransferase [Burkholderia gladioli]|uniref:GNAT family N-acetyltransferase n=1 Tax=Burkholderia gladioli TaxID=28095 RepID=UPI0038B3FB6B